MKRLLPLLVLAALVAVPAASAKRSAPPTLKAGELIVAFGDPAPSFAVGKVRGSTVTNPKGYEVDLATAVAKQLGLKPVWMYSPWTGLFAPGTKKFDISFQEATITAQRKKTVDFTSSYLNANQGVLLSKTAPTPHSLADLRKLQTCAQNDTTGLQYIQDQLKPNKHPLTYPTTTAAYQAVSVGQCQAFVLDVPLVLLQKKQTPARFGAVAGQIVTHEQYGAVLQKGSKLTMVVDGVLKKLAKNGTIAKLQKKWFNVNFAAIPVLK
ncbi:MAG TPA: ABC transporter substrate-binding protein [Gaiellaceae bacterium]|nr:ABC transporter substrate-binding protein [Gaiellaceae bacterium]